VVNVCPKKTQELKGRVYVLSEIEASGISEVVTVEEGEEDLSIFDNIVDPDNS
jgi:hypothetical protein